jgi:four helix bundle protein
MGDYHDLQAWREAVELAAEVYAISRRLPGTERFGLASQLQRAAVSVSANIAEGSGRAGDRELARFLRVARGSACEVESLLAVCLRLGLLTDAEVGPAQKRADRVSRRLTALIRRLIPA